jgi:hypothetical protein
MDIFCKANNCVNIMDLKILDFIAVVYNLTCTLLQIIELQGFKINLSSKILVHSHTLTTLQCFMNKYIIALLPQISGSKRETLWLKLDSNKQNTFSL